MSNQIAVQASTIKEAKDQLMEKLAELENDDHYNIAKVLTCHNDLLDIIVAHLSLIKAICIVYRDDSIEDAASNNEPASAAYHNGRVDAYDEMIKLLNYIA